jgi:hypothetical protein
MFSDDLDLPPNVMNDSDEARAFRAWRANHPGGNHVEFETYQQSQVAQFAILSRREPSPAEEAARWRGAHDEPDLSPEERLMLDAGVPPPLTARRALRRYGSLAAVFVGLALAAIVARTIGLGWSVGGCIAGGSVWMAASVIVDLRRPPR